MATYRVPVLDDFSWQPPVKDKDLTAPPGGEAKGDRYIVGAEATGAWADLDDHIVTYNGSGWIDATPAEGWYVYIEDENILYRYTGAAWDAEDVSALEADVTSIDTRVTNVESSVGSIDTNLTNTDSSVGSIDTSLTNVISSVGSIDTNLTATDSSVGSINTVASTNTLNISTNTAGISTNVVAIASVALIADSNASSIVSINTRATNIESSVGSINTAKQDKGTYVTEYGAIEFTI